MVFHGISIFFPVIVVHFQGHVDDQNSIEIIDLISSTDLLFGE
jgi:hypothetical protein